MKYKTLILAGDLYLKNNNYSLSPLIIKLFRNVDYSVLNLEGPILYSDRKYRKYPKVGPNIHQNVNVLNLLRELKIEYVGGANNHIIDFGRDGIISSIEILDKNFVKHSGFGLNLSSANKEMFPQDSNLAVISTCEEEFCIASKNEYGAFSFYTDDILKSIKRLKNIGKYVIVYVHGGGEKIPLPSEYIRKRYRDFINNGSDIVVGHHPHNIQGYEKYLGKYIFYSLGNFLHSYYNFSIGMLLKIKISDQGVCGFELIPIQNSNDCLGTLKNTTRFNKYLKLANRVLTAPNLFQAIYQEQAIDMYESYYKKYFTGRFKSYLSVGNYIRDRLNFSKNKFINKETYDQRLLLHLVRNKSHSDFINSALSILTGEIKDKRSKRSNLIYRQLRYFIDYEQ